MLKFIEKLISFGLRYVYAALCSLYAFSLGVFSSRQRAFIRNISEHFGYGHPPQPFVPLVSMSEFADHDAPIQVFEPAHVDGNVSLLELIVLNKMVKLFNPKTLFEIGTFDGRTTLNLAANSSSDAKIYTLDLPITGVLSSSLPLDPADRPYIDKPVSGSRFVGTSYEAKITQLLGDSASFDFCPFFNAMDFVFIDGSHSYEYVINDSKLALRLLRNGKGIIVWHDYPFWPSVARALNYLFCNMKAFKNLRNIEGTTLAYMTADQPVER